MARRLAMLDAFLWRDAVDAVSYRLDFALQLATVVFHVASLYFVAQLIGANTMVAPYGGYLPFAAVGIAVMSFLQTGFDSFAKSIHREQLHGTLEALLMAPLRPGTIVVASATWRFLRAGVLALFYLLAAVLLGGVTLRGSPLLAVALLALTTLAFASLGLVSASFIMVFKRGDPIGMMVGGVSALLGGVFYPVDALPGWLFAAAQALPITHGLDAIREVVLLGRGLDDVLPQLAVLGAFAGVGAPLGLWCFSCAVRRARREGTLLHY